MPASSIREFPSRLARDRKGYTASPMRPCMKSQAGHFMPPSLSRGPLFICNLSSPPHHSRSSEWERARSLSEPPVSARNPAAPAKAAAAAAFKKPLLPMFFMRKILRRKLKIRPSFNKINGFSGNFPAGRGSALGGEGPPRQSVRFRSLSRRRGRSLWLGVPS